LLDKYTAAKKVEPIHIEPTEETPKISYNSSTGSLEITGESYPEDASETYKPVFDWIDEVKDQLPSISLGFSLNYLNTGTSKIIIDLIMKLDEMCKEGYQTKIIWLYCEEDEDMMNLGEEYQDLAANMEIKLLKSN